MLVINDHLEIPLREFQFTFSRSSGPGGQNVNKVNTKATLRWHVESTESLSDAVRQRLIKQCRRRMTTDGDLLITSQRFRDQGRNVADCLNKLRDLVLQATVAPTTRKKTKPTKGSKKRRLKNKKLKGEKKRLRRDPKLGD